MEAKALETCSQPLSGNFTFQDEYAVVYEVSWFTNQDGNLDITLITKQPFVWGEEPQAKIVNNIIFRRGIITTERMILESTEDGFIIVAEGGSQVVDFFQVSFPCKPVPVDPFCYHFNCAVVDEVSFLSRCGPHWTDPAIPDDTVIVWGDVSPTGDVFAPPGFQPIQWVDVWSDDVDLTGGSDVTCPPDLTFYFLWDSLGIVIWDGMNYIVL